MTAYVSQAEVLASWGNNPAPAGAAALARIDSLIPTVCAELDAEVGFTFARSPTSGTETFAVRATGGPVLHLHGDVPGLAVVPTSMSFAAVWAGAVQLIAAADYIVEQWDPSSGQYDHIRLVGTTAGYDAFPNGQGLVTFVGARGFATVPANVKEAAIARIRQLFFADPTLVGGVMGPDEGGRVVLSPRPPDVFWRAVTHYRRRYATCYFR